MTRAASCLNAGILALLAVLFLVWPVWRAQFPLEIDLNEGWNAYHADDVLAGRPLYPVKDALTVNNYPPLSFYIIAGLSNWFGDPLYIGRILSLLATLGLGGVVFVCVLKLGGGRCAAAVGGLWFVATMARFFNRYVGMDDPQLLGQFVMGVGLAWFLARDGARKSAEPPILLMVLAGFIKHNIIVIPATVLLCLLLRDGVRAVRPIVVGVAAAAAGLALCVLLYGDQFLANMLAPRVYSVWRAVKSIGRLQWIAPALGIWAFWAWPARHSTAARFTILYIGLGLACCFVQWAGEGVVDNAQFDLVIAVAIGVGLAFDGAATIVGLDSHNTERVRITIASVLIARLLLSARIESFLVLASPDYRALYRANTEIARVEAARIAAMPGLVSCPLLLCRMAGKPFVYDDFKVEMMIATGAATKAQIDAAVRDRGIVFAQVDARVNMELLFRNFMIGR